MDIERQKLEIEKKKLALEQSFSKQYAVPIVTIFCAVIAGFFAVAQVQIAAINKDKELALTNIQNERKWKLDVADFVFKNRDIIFSSNIAEQRSLRDVILVTFPSEITEKLFERIEFASPVEQKVVWQEAQEMVSKFSAIEEVQNEALTLFRQGKYDESISVNNRVLEIDQNNVQALNRKGYSLFRSKKFEEAIGSLSKAVKIQPDHELANLNLAKSYCAFGNPDAAKTTLDAAFKLKPSLLQIALSDGEFSRTCKEIVPALKSNKSLKGQ